MNRLIELDAYLDESLIEMGRVKKLKKSLNRILKQDKKLFKAGGGSYPSAAAQNRAVRKAGSEVQWGSDTRKRVKGFRDQLRAKKGPGYDAVKSSPKGTGDFKEARGEMKALRKKLKRLRKSEEF